jgi:hypothetical protein
VDNLADVKKPVWPEPGGDGGRQLCPAHVPVSAARRLTCGATFGDCARLGRKV